MQCFRGKSVSQGITMGPVVVWQKEKFIAERKQVADSEAELTRFEEALELSKAQLDKLADSAIFQAQSILLEDEGFAGQIRIFIRTEQVNAEYAVQQIGNQIGEMFAAMEDAYMREREADIRDITARVLQNLRREQSVSALLTVPSVVLAEDLTPSETIQFHRDKVLAFVTAKGSANSHVAILARSMGIPALVGIDLEEVSEGPFAIVDAVDGHLILNPDSNRVEEYSFKIQQEQERKSFLQSFRNQESVTLDGFRVPICANIGAVEEDGDALLNGADGIGLFRSEYLYLGKTEFPSEEEQYQEYKRVLLCMGDKRVIIRTLDIGSDKQAAYLGPEPEANPALGCRGIRFCLRQPDIFKTQLKALLRAAVHGNLAIMYPMITSVEEVEQITKIVNEMAGELEEQGIAYEVPAQGIMVETPAAVMISDELAGMVDFFSIGTNDLTQYTLAVDRQNGSLEAFFHPHHKAILRMIQMVVENAHAAGKWVGICGELAADTMLTEKFVRMGVDELSVVPGKVPELRRKVREIRKGRETV